MEKMRKFLINYSCMLCDDVLKKTEEGKYKIRVNGKEASTNGYLCRNCYLKLIFETAPHQIKSTIRKSGGALVITIPKALAEYHDIQQGDEIIITDIGMKINKKG